MCLPKIVICIKPAVTTVTHAVCPYIQTKRAQCVILLWFITVTAVITFLRAHTAKNFTFAFTMCAVAFYYQWKFWWDDDEGLGVRAWGNNNGGFGGEYAAKATRLRKQYLLNLKLLVVINHRGKVARRCVCGMAKTMISRRKCGKSCKLLFRTEKVSWLLKDFAQFFRRSDESWSATKNLQLKIRVNDGCKLQTGGLCWIYASQSWFCCIINYSHGCEIYLRKKRSLLSTTQQVDWRFIKS